MHYGLLQIGEVTLGSHPILARDVNIGVNKRKFLIILRTSKTHWKNMKPQMIKITAMKDKQNGQTDNNPVSNKLPCPYGLLKDYSQRRGNYSSDREPFFVFSDKTLVIPRHVTVILKKILKEAGF